MSEHTPGPWTIHPQHPAWIIGSDGLPVAHNVYEFNRGNEGANARLIAAAPELLDACRAALAFIDANFHYADGKASPCYDMPARIALVAAIAKAEGRQA